jgi:nucleoside-diphosphate-sugar epimerase
MPTSVVTGGAGFLGSHLTDALLAKGHRVICVDNVETGSLANIEHHPGPDPAGGEREHMPVNIGNPQEFTLLQLAEKVIEIWGSSSEIVHEALPTDDPKQREPDITRARQLLGWEPEIPLDDGLRRLRAALPSEAIVV